MRCSRCTTDNLLMARYCCACGKPFSEEERKAAYDQTIYGQIDKARKVKDVLTLNIITDSLWFKILTLLLILAIGIWLRMSGVNALRLESGDGYRLEYLKATNTYYVISESDAVDLRFVVPHKTTQLVEEERDDVESLLSQRSCGTEEAVTLDVSGENHYVLRSYRGEKNTGSLTVFVYRESEAAQ